MKPAIKPIGVLGGMGPEATVLFMSRMMAAVDAKDDADHVPLLVDQNSQVPSRIEAILGDGGADPGPVLAMMAQRLEAAGASALVMPCNTAHHFAPAVQAAVEIPFLNMVEMACDHAASLAPFGSMGLLGSPALQKAKVFEKPVAARDLKHTPPTHPDAVLSLIRAIKAEGVSPDVVKQLSMEAHALAKAGADAICICCTEFSLVAEQVSAPVPVFDALDLLVKASVRFANGEPWFATKTASADNRPTRAILSDMEREPI